MSTHIEIESFSKANLGYSDFPVKVPCSLRVRHTWRESGFLD